jgi:hypothetical protein
MLMVRAAMHNGMALHRALGVTTDRSPVLVVIATKTGERSGGVVRVVAV